MDSKADTVGLLEEEQALANDEDDEVIELQPINEDEESKITETPKEPEQRTQRLIQSVDLI